MLDFLPGRKTYILGLASVVWGAASAWFPDLGAIPVADDPMMVIMGGLTAMGLRKGMEQ